jgi:hypothetical protein
MKLKGPTGPRGYIVGQPRYAILNPDWRVKITEDEGRAEIEAAIEKLSMDNTDNVRDIATIGLTYGTVIYSLHPDYDALPEGIKIAFSPRDYSVMPDEEKKTLLFDIMNPEVEED